MRGRFLPVATTLWLVATGTAFADREPVLKQIDLPHSYYWREMYLPQLTTGPSSLSFLPALRSPVAVDHLELVMNGAVVKTFALKGDRRHLDASGRLRVDRNGWLVLRAWNDHADSQVLDIYPYATTSPVYVAGGPPAPAATADAQYFVAWLDRVIEAATARDDYNDESEKRATLAYLQQARAGYVARAGAAR